MTAQVVLQFNNLPELARNLLVTPRDIVEKVGRDIEREAKDSMVGGGSPHESSAPGDPPHVDTGHLKNSIRFTATGETEGEVAVAAEYGAHLEFGTSRMAARPFMTPAVEREAQDLERIGAEIVRKAIP